MFMARIPSRATPRITSIDVIRSRVVTGPATTAEPAGAAVTLESGKAAEVATSFPPERRIRVTTIRQGAIAGILKQ